MRTKKDKPRRTNNESPRLQFAQLKLPMGETEPILQSRRNLVGGGSVSKLGLVGRNKNKPAGNCNREAKKRTEDEKTRQGTALATRHDNTRVADTQPKKLIIMMGGGSWIPANRSRSSGFRRAGSDERINVTITSDLLVLSLRL